jgi:hypothetical protein
MTGERSGIKLYDLFKKCVAYQRFPGAIKENQEEPRTVWLVSGPRNVVVSEDIREQGAE